MSTRDVLVEALGKVEPALDVHSAAPGVVSTGSAWPVWASTEWQSACMTRESWYVFVALPNADQLTTDTAGDVQLVDVAAALFTVGKVERVEPWAWPVESGQQAVPVLRFTLAMSGGI